MRLPPRGRKPPLLDIRIASDAASVRALLMTLGEALVALKGIPDDLATLEIVLAEALNNIVEHAYPPGTVDGEIRIVCRAHPDAFELTLVDHGQPMPSGDVPGGGLAALDGPLEELPEGGFGWHLIHGLSREVRYARKGSENHLSLQIARARRG